MVDGGIADNLGLRAVIDYIEGSDDGDFGEAIYRQYTPKDVLIILVNAEVKPDLLIEKTARKPSVSATMSAFTSAQMNRYNQETIDRLKLNLNRLETISEELGEPMNIYFSEVSFDSVKTIEINRFLNRLPTSLTLEDNQVDLLINAGRLLLRNENQFKLFKQNKQLKLIDGALTEEALCTMAGVINCGTPQAKVRTEDDNVE